MMALLRRFVRWWFAISFPERVEEVEPRPRTSGGMVLDVYHDGEIVRALAMDVRGPLLLVQIGASLQLIGDGAAVCRDEYTRIWKSFCLRLVWEDGTEYDPAE